MGGRTAERVGDEVAYKFENVPAWRISGDILCKVPNAVFCDIRNKILKELMKEKPMIPDTSVREMLTDIKTAFDLASWNDCDPECKPIEEVIQDPQFTEEKKEIKDEIC